jgi:hypothetical protein
MHPQVWDLARNASAGSWRVLDTVTPVCRAGGQNAMRMIRAALSERAAADRRKCCAMTPARREPIQPPSWHHLVHSTTHYFLYKISLVAADTQGRYTSHEVFYLLRLSAISP